MLHEPALTKETVPLVTVAIEELVELQVADPVLSYGPYSTPLLSRSHSWAIAVTVSPPRPVNDEGDIADLSKFAPHPPPGQLKLLAIPSAIFATSALPISDPGSISSHLTWPEI